MQSGIKACQTKLKIYFEKEAVGELQLDGIWFWEMKICLDRPQQPHDVFCWAIRNGTCYSQEQLSAWERSACKQFHEIFNNKTRHDTKDLAKRTHGKAKHESYEGREYSFQYFIQIRLPGLLKICNDSDLAKQTHGKAKHEREGGWDLCL